MRAPTFTDVHRRERHRCEREVEPTERFAQHRGGPRRTLCTLDIIPIHIQWNQTKKEAPTLVEQRVACLGCPAYAYLCPPSCDCPPPIPKHTHNASPRRFSRIRVSVEATTVCCNGGVRCQMSNEHRYTTVATSSPTQSPDGGDGVINGFITK